MGVRERVAERGAKPAAGTDLGRRRFVGRLTVGGLTGVGTLALSGRAATAQVDPGPETTTTTAPPPETTTTSTTAPPTTTTTTAPPPPEPEPGVPAPVASPLPVAVPQLRGVPVTLYGHSWTVPAPWHGPGNHWTERFVAAVGCGALRNTGIGGSHLEGTAQGVDGKPAGAYAATLWAAPATKTLALVMDTLNSAAVQPVSTSVQSLRSFELAGRHLAATVLSSKVHATPARGRMDYSAGWSAHADPMSSSGNWRYATAQGASVTWTPTVSAPMAWIEGVAYNLDIGFAFACDVEVRVGDELRFAGQLSANERDPKVSSRSEPVDYMKVSVPVGPVVAGRPVVITKTSATGMFVFDGCQVLDAKHHVAFVLEPSRIDPARQPAYQAASIEAHNGVLRAIKHEFDAFAPGGVSLVDLARHADFDAASLLWIGDGLHPNDRGQSWLLARITQELLANVPWTSRLHTL